MLDNMKCSSDFDNEKPSERYVFATIRKHHIKSREDVSVSE